MTSAEPSRGLQDKHSFVCKWKSWGCETKARSEQGWDLNHSARLQIRPSQNPPLQRKRFSPLPAPLSRGNFFWQVSVAQLVSLSYWSREWCQNWKHFQRPSHSSQSPEHSVCAQKVLGGSDTQGTLMPIFLKNHLSSATLRTLYSSLTCFMSQWSRSHPEPLFCWWRKRGRGRGRNRTRGTSPYQLPSQSNFAASTCFSQHLLLSYAELTR